MFHCVFFALHSHYCIGNDGGRRRRRRRCWSTGHLVFNAIPPHPVDSTEDGELFMLQLIVSCVHSYRHTIANFLCLSNVQPIEAKL